MIKAFIFDINGVLIKSPYLSDRFYESFGVPPEDFLPALKSIMARIRKPDAGDAFSYWRPYLDKWNVSLTKDEFFDFWFSKEKEVPETVELAGLMKTMGFMMLILSNNFMERADTTNRIFRFWKKRLTGYIILMSENHELQFVDEAINSLKPNQSNHGL